MGVTGLLPFLQKASRPAKMREFAGRPLRKSTFHLQVYEDLFYRHNYCCRHLCLASQRCLQVFDFVFFVLNQFLCMQLRRGPSAGQTNRRICEICYEVNFTSRISLKSERKFHAILMGEVHCICRWCDMLLHHKIKPILVFDGRNLPSKALTEKKRRAKRLA